MIDKKIREKISARAFEIYEWRKENGIGGNATTDWFDAQEEVLIDKRVNNGCPNCGFSLLARKNNMIICLRCDWKITARRKLDEDIPDFEE